MTIVSLFPPLEQVEQRLFGVPDDLLLRLSQGDTTVPEQLRQAALADPYAQERIRTLQEAAAEPLILDEEFVQIPAFMQTLIDQKVAAAKADFGKTPARGQLIQLTALPTAPGQTSDLQLSTPVVVLLAAQDPQSLVWHGWIVSPDVQYASFWDFLLQPEDEPFDPVCGMVQIWNPVQLYFSEDIKPFALGALSKTRMQAVEALALEYVLGDPELPHPRPGVARLRPVGDGFSAVTGTPLAPSGDPRYFYQQCYHHLATLLNEPVRAWQLAAVADGNILTALRDVIAAAWHELAGNLPQPTPQVAFAMNDNIHEEDVLMLALQENLRLSLSRVNTYFDLRLEYSGTMSLTATVFDDGEFAKRGELKTGSPPLEYTGLNFHGDNRLRIDWQDGASIELPLTLD